MYEIYEIKENKKQYLDLLLLADEQEDMIDRYLERGTMFILDDNGVKAVCVITKEKDKTIEIKNIAVNNLHGKIYLLITLTWNDSITSNDFLCISSSKPAVREASTIISASTNCDWKVTALLITHILVTIPTNSISLIS